MKEFYIVKYKPDGKSAPYFFDLEWSPELPEFHYPSKSPTDESFAESYSAVADVKGLRADWLIDHFLGSDRFLAICDEFDCRYVSRAIDLSLSDSSESLSKSYNFFVPLDRVRAMDVEKSSFVIDGNDKTGFSEDVQYEKIDKLVIRNDIELHLFYFEEIREFVCSREFFNVVSEKKIIGLDFSLIDSGFKYAPWEDF